MFKTFLYTLFAVCSISAVRAETTALAIYKVRIPESRIQVTTESSETNKIKTRSYSFAVIPSKDSDKNSGFVNWDMRDAGETILVFNGEPGKTYKITYKDRTLSIKEGDRLVLLLKIDADIPG